MGAKFAVFLVALLCNVAALHSDVIRKLGWSSTGHSGIPQLTTVQKKWNYCREGLKDGGEAVVLQDLDLSQSTRDSLNGVEYDSTSLLRNIIQNVVTELPLNKKEIILHCLREENLTLGALRNEREIWSDKFTMLFSSWGSIPRRYLRHKLGRHKVSGNALSLAPALSPGNAPSLAPAFSPDFFAMAPMHQVPVPSPNFKSASRGRRGSEIAPSPVTSSPPPDYVTTSPIHDKVPMLTPSNSHASLKQSPASASSMPSGTSPPPSFRNSHSPATLPENIKKYNNVGVRNEESPDPSQEDKVYRKYYIAAVAVTCSAAAASILVSCLVYYPKRKVDPNDGQRDGNLPVKLNLIDAHTGSALNLQAFGTSTNTDSEAHLSDWSSLDVESRSVGGSVESYQRPVALRPPPGKTAPPPRGKTASPSRGKTIPPPPGKTAPPPPPSGKRVPPPPGKRVPPPPSKTAPLPPPSPKPPSPAPPPPPPKVGCPPPKPPPKNLAPGTHHRHSCTEKRCKHCEQLDAPRTKLKPFFWDKVATSPNRSMVWHDIKAGSFQFNEEMIEDLFGYATADSTQNPHKKDLPPFENTQQFIRIIDPKKSQNLAILLKASNLTTDDICDALREGNELPAELCQTLLRMAPTSDEELKLRAYSGDISLLGPAERFLKLLIDIPFGFKRLEALLFKNTFEEEFPTIKESFATLEQACTELKNSRLFLKLLEAVLKTGNRMNDGTFRGGATAFKLNTLLKLSDVKGTDGKTTLLHFVVHEIIRSEGARAARRLRETQSALHMERGGLVEDNSQNTEKYHRSLGLQVVSGLGNELQHVKKAAAMDNQKVSATMSKLRQSLAQTMEFLETDMKSTEEEGSEFYKTLSSVATQYEADIKWLINEEKRIMDLMKSTGDYFHGKAGKDEGLRLFEIVKDFLSMLDKACNDVKASSKGALNAAKKEASTAAASTPCESVLDMHHRLFPASTPSESVVDMHKRLFPAMRARHIDDEFSSDDEG